MQYKLEPFGDLVTMREEPQLMVGMMGYRFHPDDIQAWAAQAGLYSKYRRPSHEAHWYSVVEAGSGTTGLSAEDKVVADLTFRDHSLQLADDKLTIMRQQYIIGKLDMGDEKTPMKFQTLGTWMLAVQDDNISARLMGADRLIVTTGTLDRGQRTSEDFGDNLPERENDGVRWRWARVIDAGPQARCQPGDAVGFMAGMGVVDVPLGGTDHIAIQSASAIGRVTADQLPKWERPRPRTADDVLDGAQ